MLNEFKNVQVKSKPTTENITLCANRFQHSFIMLNFLHCKPILKACRRYLLATSTHQYLSQRGLKHTSKNKLKFLKKANY